MGPLDVEFEHPPPGENQYDDAGKRKWKRLMMLYGKASEPEYKKVSRQVSTLGNHGAPNVTKRAKKEAKTVGKRVSTPKTSGRSIEKETAPTSDPEDQADNSIEGPRFVVTPLVEKTAIHYREIGLSEREIATIVGMNPSTVVRLHRKIL